MKSKQDVSVILPTFNECQNLSILIPQIEKLMVNDLCEIIVVDDGSNDGTQALLEGYKAQFGNIRLIERYKLLGIGSALRDGYNAARGMFLLSSDADQSYSVSDMQRLFSKVKEGYDLVVGYRHGVGAYYERKTPAVRVKHLVSRMGNFFVRTLSRIPVHDFSANFRIIRGNRWRELETQETTNTLLFEMIFLAHRRGLAVAEIPIRFSERHYGVSKLNLWKEAPKFLLKFIYYTWMKT